MEDIIKVAQNKQCKYILKRKDILVFPPKMDVLMQDMPSINTEIIFTQTVVVFKMHSLTSVSYKIAPTL